MQFLKLGAVAFILASMAGLAANADEVSISCGQTVYPDATTGCGGTISLQCNPNYAEIYFNTASCQYYKLPNNGGAGRIQSPSGYGYYRTSINSQFRIKITQEANGVAGLIVNINTNYISAPVPGPLPPPSGPLPPPSGPLPPPSSGYTGLDQPRAYFLSNLFSNNTQWVNLTGQDKGGCGGSAAVFFGNTVRFSGVRACNVVDAYDASGNLLAQNAANLEGYYGSYSGDLPAWWTQGRSQLYLKLHSANYSFGNKIHVFIVR